MPWMATAARCHRWGFQLAASALDHPGTTWVPLVRIQQSEPQVPLSKAPPKPGLTRTLLHTHHRGRALTQTLANQEFALCSPKSRARPGRKSPPLGNGHGRSLLMFKSRPLRTGAAFWPEIRAINYFAGVIIAIETW